MRPASKKANKVVTAKIDNVKNDHSPVDIKILGNERALSRRIMRILAPARRARARRVRGASTVPVSWHVRHRRREMKSAAGGYNSPLAARSATRRRIGNREA